MEKSINNLELITPLLHFEKEGDFINVIILLRKKDQKEGEKDNHQSVRIIKSYCVESLEYLNKKMPEIINLCEYFNARAYIQINEKNHNDVGLLMMEKLASRIRNNITNQVNLFDSVAGELKSKRKRWIVDIDTKNRSIIHQIGGLINSIQPSGDKIIAEIPTLNGSHLITLPFDVSEFNKYMKLRTDEVIDVQKNNPTVLYVPSTMIKNNKI